jgi:hypothetical protein
MVQTSPRTHCSAIARREQNSVSEEILELARINRCGTIILGRRSLPWLRRLTAGKAWQKSWSNKGAASCFGLWSDPFAVAIRHHQPTRTQEERLRFPIGGLAG